MRARARAKARGLRGSLPVRASRSEPARSTRRRPPCITVPSAGLRMSTLSMNSTWLREDSLFMPVAAVVRVLLAHVRRALSCDMPLATSDESRGSLFSPATFTVRREQVQREQAAAEAAVFIGVVVTREGGECWQDVSDIIVEKAVLLGWVMVASIWR